MNPDKAVLAGVVAIVTFPFCLQTIRAEEEKESGLRAPIPGFDSVQEPAETPRPGLDFIFQNSVPENAGALLRYDELLTLIVNRQIESVTIDRDLSVALARPRPGAGTMKVERIVSLPYWSYRETPDFVLRALCESYETDLIIAAENDEFFQLSAGPIHKSLAFWALIGTALNFLILLAVFRRLRSLSQTISTVKSVE